MHFRFRATAVIAVLGVCAAFWGCSAGELRLLDEHASGGGGGAGGSTTSGGAPSGGGSGGTVLSTGGWGAVGSSTGGACADVDCYPECGQGGRTGKDYGCEPAACDPHEEGCWVCSSSFECPGTVPFCSPATSRCVQCLRRDDCLGLFGGVKPVCWAGQCTSCQIDDDCPFGLQCDLGVCGRCKDDDDCPNGLECKDYRCAPL